MHSAEVSDRGASTWASNAGVPLVRSFRTGSYLLYLQPSPGGPLEGLEMGSVNGYLATHAAISLVAGTVLAGLAELFFPRFVNRAVHRVRRGFILDPLDNLMKGETSLHIAVATTTHPAFHRLGSGDPITLPENAPFLPFGQAMGMADLRGAVNDRYGKKRSVEIEYADRFGLGWKHSFVALGGPYVHPIVKDVLDRGLVQGFAVEDGPVVKDEGERFHASRDGTTPRSPLTTDIGVIIWMRNPYNESRKLCILFGLWPPGTFAAVDAFLNRSVADAKLQRKFRRLVRSGQDCVAIVETSISALTIGVPTIRKVRSFTYQHRPTSPAP
jgi:hypothetical protein